MTSDKILNLILIFLIAGLCLLGGYFYFVNNASSENIAGVDANNNGVRDDVEEYINTKYGQDHNLKAALMEYARYSQLELLNASNEELSIKYSHEDGSALECVWDLSRFSETARREIWKDVRDKILNSNSRRAANRKQDSHLGGQVYSLGSYSCQDVPDIIYKVGVVEDYLKESGIAFQTYKSIESGFEVDYPTNWHIQFEDNKSGLLTIASVPKEENIHGIGIPYSGNMWVHIAKGICNEPTTDYVSQTPDLNISEKTTCKDGFQITAGLWDDDVYSKGHKNLLDAILNSFRLTPKDN